MPTITGNLLIDALLYIASTAGVLKGIEQVIFAWQKRNATLRDSETGDIVQLRKDVWEQLAEAREEQRRQRAADAATIEALRKELAALIVARIADAQTIGELRGQLTALQTEVALFKAQQQSINKEKE
jgi:chromosome segregation ATPase